MGYGGATVDAEITSLREKLVVLEQQICSETERQRTGKKPLTDPFFLCRLHGALRARLDRLNCCPTDLRVLRSTVQIVTDPCVRAELRAYIETIENGQADNGIPPVPVRDLGVPAEGFPGVPAPPQPPPGQPWEEPPAVTVEAVLNARIDRLERTVFELRKGMLFAGGGGGGSAETRIVENVTPITGGTDGHVLFNNNGIVSGEDAFSWDDVTNTLTVGSLAVTADNGVALTGQTDAAAAGAGTLTNAPIAGDPTWIRVVRNGVNGAIPWWRIP